MKMIEGPIVLLDMDGVICNFIGGVLHSLREHPTIKLPPKLIYNKWNAWNFHQQIGISDNDFWGVTKQPNWWLNLPSYSWATELIDGIRSFGAHILFTSSPSLDSACVSQKIDWLRDYGFMAEHANDYHFGPHKYMMAKHPQTVLVDDSVDNVNAFKACGGKAILFPAPWNTREAQNPYQTSIHHNEDAIAEIIAEVKAELLS